MTWREKNESHEEIQNEGLNHLFSLTFGNPIRAVKGQT